MKPVAALLFDLDGTLLDSGAANRDAVEATCADLSAQHSELDANRLVGANGEAWTRYWPEVERRWVLGDIGGASVSAEVWRRTLRSCGCDDSKIAATACELHAHHLRASLRLYPEVPALIGSLAGRVKLALVTNGASDTQRGSLRHLGIEQAFAAVAVSGELGIAKPDPAIFETALRDLGVGPDEAWHVGDGPVTDVEGAQAAGLTAVWLNRSGGRWEGAHPPAHEIASLTELVELLPDVPQAL
jgi:2-haloalkanoic acid dehalogenase type II